MFKHGDRVKVREFEAVICGDTECSDGTWNLALDDETSGIYVPTQHLEKVVSYEYDGLYEDNDGRVYRCCANNLLVNLITGRTVFASDITGPLHHLIWEEN